MTSKNNTGTSTSSPIIAPKLCSEAIPKLAMQIAIASSKLLPLTLKEIEQVFLIYLALTRNKPRKEKHTNKIQSKWQRNP